MSHLVQGLAIFEIRSLRIVALPIMASVGVRNIEMS